MIFITRLGTGTNTGTNFCAFRWVERLTPEMDQRSRAAAEMPKWIERCPPKAKVTRSNRVGCASHYNSLPGVQRALQYALSALCPRNLFC
jgi:hypothetical protein